LNSDWPKLKPLGVELAASQLLMERSVLEWSIDEFLERVGDFAPTLVLIKMTSGTECGGVAGVPWPKNWYERAADLSKGSFIFSLGATPTRFELVYPEWTLFMGVQRFEFGHRGCDLYVYCDGDGCGSHGQ
jgi:hypothetical protein